MVASRNKRKPRRGEAHVRLYRHELECEAWRTMSLAGRAFVIELRSLYNGGENSIHLSREETQRRLGVGRRIAERARDEALERGWARLLEAGQFGRKVRHASVYAITNEPLSGDGPAPKDFMKWQPEKNHAVHFVHPRGTPRTTRVGKKGQNPPSRGTPCTTSERISPPHAVHHVPTDTVTTGVRESSNPLLWAVSQPGVDEKSGRAFCLAALLLANADVLAMEQAA